MSLLGRNLDGEVAFISGASAGIGASIAVRLAESGATVVLGARRTAKLDAVKERILNAKADAKVVTLPLDVNDDKSVDAWLENGAKEAGEPTILVNNAGLAKGAAKIAEVSMEDVDLVLQTNVRAAMNLTRKVVPTMLKNGRGDVAMIASVAGIDAYPGGGVYCASKAALQMFAQVLRKETLGQGIRVFTFDPGMVETEFSSVRFDDQERAKTVYAGMTPLSGDDVADCVAFAVTRPLHMNVDRMLILATDQSSATTVHRKK